MWLGLDSRISTQMTCMCLREIGSRAQNMLTVLDLIVNMTGDMYDHLMSTRILVLIIGKTLIWISRIMRRMNACIIWIC